MWASLWCGNGCGEYYMGPDELSDVHVTGWVCKANIDTFWEFNFHWRKG